jgi:hypothetical protein
MKTITIKIFNLVIILGLNIFRTKQLTYYIPDNADDVSVTLLNSPDKTYKVRYFQSGTGAGAQFIDLPKCRQAKQISLTPMYCYCDGTKHYCNNRKIVVQIDY